MGKFDPKKPEPTDQDLLELLATRGMGWELFNLSGHRPGDRAVPHAWRWDVDGRVRIMVFVGGHGHEANVEFNPLEDQDSAQELADRMAGMGMPIDAADLGTQDGRRDLCQAAADRLIASSVESPAELVPEPASPAAFSDATPFDPDVMGWAAAGASNAASVAVAQVEPPADDEAGAAATIPDEPSPPPLAADAEIQVDETQVTHG